jgi:hypothetical protein
LRRSTFAPAILIGRSNGWNAPSTISATTSLADVAAAALTGRFLTPSGATTSRRWAGCRTGRALALPNLRAGDGKSVIEPQNRLEEARILEGALATALAVTFLFRPSHDE